MKKFAVYFKSRVNFVETYIHIFAESAEQAVIEIERDGVGYYNGHVYPTQITGVREVEQ